MPDPLEFNVSLMNEKVKFQGALRDNPPITTDYYPPLGDGEGYTSLELLLMSLATCSGTSVVMMLRKMHKTVSGFIVHAKGIRREQHPTGFKEILLQFIVTSADVTEDDLQKAIQLSEETYCPVWAMLKGNVEIACETKIITP